MVDVITFPMARTHHDCNVCDALLELADGLLPSKYLYPGVSCISHVKTLVTDMFSMLGDDVAIRRNALRRLVRTC
jgi:hypothetical protein